jgi:hypothetical protein
MSGGPAVMIPSTHTAQAIPPVLEERPQAEVVDPSPIPENQRTTAAAATDTESTPTKANVTNTTTTTSTDIQKKHPWNNGVAATATTDGKFQESMDNSLINSGDIDFNMDGEVDNNYDGESSEDDYKPPSAPPPTPAERPLEVNSSNEEPSIGTSQNTPVAVNTAAGASTKTTALQPENRFTPVYVNSNAQEQHSANDNDDNEPIDDATVGQTVASSTYGEDRIKVANRSLLDPYGDKGIYTGVVLRTTGMPHGLGRMIYEEDGRIYEGDW